MKLRSGYEKGIEGTCLIIEIPLIYKADYKYHMIQENEIHGLLQMSGCGVEKKSRYSYTITGMISMKDKYEQQMFLYEDVMEILKDIFNTMCSMRKYMLDPESLLLYPEFIFWDGEEWKFCCLPPRKKVLSESFHTLSEYFIRKIDLRDMKGVMLGFELHKATFYKHFDLENILTKYTVEEGEEELEESMQEEPSYYVEEKIYTLDEESPTIGKDIKEVKEQRQYATSWQQKLEKIKKNCKEGFKDFLIESDGHKDGELL